MLIGHSSVPVHCLESQAQRPFYLAPYMVCFAWRRDIGKKAKIMVSGASHLIINLTELCRLSVHSVKSISTEVGKDRSERRKVRKPTKNAVEPRRLRPYFPQNLT